jgi:PilZ domain
VTDFASAVEDQMSRKVEAFKEAIITEIGADRRDRNRYAIELNVEYRLLKPYPLSQSGAGKTVNLSGGGIAVKIGDVLSPGSAIELTIEWPTPLNATRLLHLVVTGRVVRSTTAITAVRMDRYEFRAQDVRTLQARAAS